VKNGELVMKGVSAKNVVKLDTRRGRPAKDGHELYIPGLRCVIENKPITLYYKRKLAEKGFIGLIPMKTPGTRGRPELRAILTTKGLRYFEKYQGKFPGYLESKVAVAA
jgi:hypothetical protein